MILFMKKLLGIVVLSLVLVGCAPHGAVVKSVYDPTYSVSEAINDHFTPKRKLETIEGVWVRQGDGFSFAIYKSGNNFDIKIIQPDNYSYAKEVVGSLTKNSDTNYTGNRNIIYAGSTSSSSVVFNVSNDQINATNTSKWGVANNKYFRNWPSNLYTYNSSINKPKKKQKPKSTPDDNKIVPAGSGSGFFVSKDGHIITNHHVIDDCNTTNVHFNGNQLDTQILAADKMNDIAILKTNIKPNSIFPVSNEDVSLLEDIVVAGYPLGKKVSSAIKTHKGVVTALAGAGDNFSNFQTDASINAGNSGGPIMNQKGNIVGIAVATWVEDGVQGVHFGIKSSTLKTFATSNNLAFTQPNNRDLSNKDLGKLITEATVYLECHMTIANIKKMIAAANNRKAFFSEYQ